MLTSKISFYVIIFLRCQKWRKSMTFCTKPEAAAAQQPCEHVFSITEQRNRILDQDSLVQGRSVFVQQKRCSKCGHTKSTETTAPECLNCGAVCTRTSDDLVRSRLNEFQSAQDGSLDHSHAFGTPRGYLCTECDRPHVYVMEGD